MMSKEVTPQKVYALVVGIERYDWPAVLEDLKGCANDAIKFAKWLSDQGVPPGNISLCLSSLDAKLDLELPPGISRQAANQSTVSGILDDLVSVQGDMLFLFWAGHGVIKGSTQRLFFADAAERNPLNMDIFRELEALKTSAYDTLSNLFCFVDACATPIEEIELNVKLPDNILRPIKLPYKPNWEHYISFAAKEGQAAERDTTGYFTRVLMEELKVRMLPLDLEELSKTLIGRFERLRQEDSKFNQTPNYYWGRGKYWNRPLDYRHVDTPLLQPIPGQTIIKAKKGGIAINIMHGNIYQYNNSQSDEER